MVRFGPDKQVSGFFMQLSQRTMTDKIDSAFNLNLHTMKFFKYLMTALTVSAFFALPAFADVPVDDIDLTSSGTNPSYSFPGDYPDLNSAPDITDANYYLSRLGGTIDVDDLTFFNPNIDNELELEVAVSGGNAVVKAEIVRQTTDGTFVSIGGPKGSQLLADGAETLYIYWDGTDDGGSLMDAGKYYFKVQTIVDSGDINEYHYPVKIDYQNPADSNYIDHRITCDPCTPGSDDATIYYYFTGEGDHVTVSIRNSQLTEVKKLVDNEPAAKNTNNSVTWDYKNKSGTEVSSGLYYYVIEVSNGSGQYYSDVKIAFSVDNPIYDPTDPVLPPTDPDTPTSEPSSPDPETPSDSGQTDSDLFHSIGCSNCVYGEDDVSITYAYNSDSNDVTVEILTPQKTLVKTVVKDGSLKANTSKFANWDYKNKSGVFAADGEYIYRVTVYDTKIKRDVVAEGRFKISNPLAPSQKTESTTVSEEDIYDAVGNCESFTDVSWQCEAVHYVRTNGIMTGTAPATFSPDTYLQRDQVAKIILMTYGLYQNGVDYCEGQNPFPDVTPNDWSYQYVCRAKDLGIVTGYKAGEFAGMYKPANLVTLPEFYTMLLRRVELTEDLGAFEVYGSEWYGKYLNYALKYNLLDSDEILMDSTLRRIMVAEDIYNLSEIGKIK